MGGFAFTKMHGIGNDFVMVNALQNPLPEPSLPEIARKVCDRRFGIGADGLILATQGRDVPYAMRMFNPDGSESEMCGNGVRCFLAFLHQEGLTAESSVLVETGAGVLGLQSTDSGQVRVNMGKARLNPREIGMDWEGELFLDQPISDVRGTAVSMGNPHMVIFVPDVAGVDLEQVGPALENHPLFPARVNVHFVQVLSRTHLRQRTWERGAGVTLACGTGACACGVASFLNGHSERQVLIDLPGGRLEIDYSEDGIVWMTGPAETVFQGEWAGT